MARDLSSGPDHGTSERQAWTAVKICKEQIPPAIDERARTALEPPLPPIEKEANVQSIRRRHIAHLHHRVAAAALLVQRGSRIAELSRSHEQLALSRAIRGCRLLLPAGAGDRRPRYRDRRR